jgi:hypothetical protein
VPRTGARHAQVAIRRCLRLPIVMRADEFRFFARQQAQELAIDATRGGGQSPAPPRRSPR